MASLLTLMTNVLLGYVGLILFFYLLSLAIPRAGFVARVLVSYANILAAAIFGGLASIFLTIIGQQRISQWVTGRWFHFTMRWTTGIRFTVDDPRDILGTTRPAVFVGNHQSELDMLMLSKMFPKYCSVTAKIDLKPIPFLGWFMRLSGTIFINRNNSKDARHAMAGAAKEIRDKRQSVYIFPEGTRSYTKEPELLPFKKGAFHLAIQAGVPIVPCITANYSHILYLKNMVFKSGTIPIRSAPSPPWPSAIYPRLALACAKHAAVLDPIPTKGLTSADVDELSRTTRELMLKELIILSAEAKGQPIPDSGPLNGSPVATSTGIDTSS
ncbi:AtaAp protein [Drechmeria coniospora]|uniref:1-acyl-sn-glycerol-3-phosphate acyltransferase n=1 Tax=Drechmeria coniospora TaxID=98403 RepID=A0A151GT14_DRECN|nr:AtaAp protein [Drechmeria coniospora]KYK60218.1 AtaAp protein [Drechmeria coniospora]